MSDDPIRERVARALMRECYGNAEFPSEAQKASWFKQADAALRECGYEEMRRALVELRLTARILFQNSIGCYDQHHGRDCKQLGLPGWLADSDAVIKRAEAIIDARAALSRTQGETK